MTRFTCAATVEDLVLCMVSSVLLLVISLQTGLHQVLLLDIWLHGCISLTLQALICSQCWAIAAVNEVPFGVTLHCVHVHVQITALGNPKLLERVAAGLMAIRNLFSQFDLDMNNVITREEFIKVSQQPCLWLLPHDSSSCRSHSSTAICCHCQTATQLSIFSCSSGLTRSACNHDIAV